MTTTTAPDSDEQRRHERGPLDPDELDRIDAWWRAANYLSVGQIYLRANPLLNEPLSPDHVKARLLGHWGTTPGLNLVYAHANRVIKRNGLSAIFVCGPGHGGPAVLASTWLEGSYSEIYPHIGRDAAGMERLFHQFSYPGGVPSHAAPETPGSINEGGELGYSLLHAYGAVLDDPDLVAFCVIGDGEAETGALATSWHSNKFLNPARDGAVVPILHLNGYKIAGPTVLARISEGELLALLEGYGYHPIVVAGDDPAVVHQALAAAFDDIVDEIGAIRRHARRPGGPGVARAERPTWPMLVLRTPKGWTGPHEVDGLLVEGTWRAHQVPLDAVRTNPEHLACSSPGCAATARGSCSTGTVARCPRSSIRLPRATGGWAPTRRPTAGWCSSTLDLPDFRDYGVEVGAPGVQSSETTRVLGTWLRDVMRANSDRFRVMGPDETASNRLEALFEVTDRVLLGEHLPTDEHVSAGGRVMEVLSEHCCQGWLEGYLLSGRHGLFNCYEGFIHIVDSMFNQHAKWLETSRQLPWRAPVASLNYLLSSHVWRQDHNGFSHQDPGFVDLVVNKKAEVVRVYFPPDANCLLSVMDHCLRSRDYVNVVIAGKQPTLDWLSMDEAVDHCTRGIGIWPFASNDQGGEPDVVLACCGDVPDPRDPRGRGLPAAQPARAAHPGRQRRRPDAPAARGRAPPRPARRRVRRAVHDEPTGDLRLPRLSLADPSPHLPAPQPRQPARARLQGRGHHHDAVRHGDDERPRPVPPRDGRDRPGPGARRRAAELRQHGDGPPRRGAPLHARAGRGPARDLGLDLARLRPRARRRSAQLSSAELISAGDSPRSVDPRAPCASSPSTPARRASSSPSSSTARRWRGNRPTSRRA